MNKLLPSFRPSMSPQEFINSFRDIRKGLDAYAHDVGLENGEFVVHLRRPTISENLKMALMPKKMQRERVAVLHKIIFDMANKMGVDGHQLLRDVSRGRGDHMADRLNIVVQELALKNQCRGRTIAD